MTNCSGFTELVEEELVQAIPANASAPQIAKAIAEQLGGDMIPCRISLPTWEGCADRLLEVYGSILG